MKTKTKIPGKGGLAATMTVLLALSLLPAGAQTDTFSNAAGGSYTTGSNWSLTTAPGSANAVVIPDLGTTLVVDYDSTAVSTAATPPNSAAGLTLTADTGSDAVSLDFGTKPTITAASTANLTNTYYTTPSLTLNSTASGSALITGDFGTTTASPITAAASGSFSTNINLINVNAANGLTIDATSGTAGIDLTGLKINNAYPTSTISGVKVNTVSVITVGSGTGAGAAGQVTLGGTGGTDEIIIDAQSDNNGTQSKPSYTALNLLSNTNGKLTVQDGGYFQVGYTGDTSTQTGGSAPGSNTINNVFVAVNGQVQLQGGSFVVARSQVNATNYTANQAEVQGNFNMSGGLLELDGATSGSVTSIGVLIEYGIFNATGGTILFQNAGDYIGLHNVLGGGAAIAGMNYVGADVTFDFGDLSTTATPGNAAAGASFNFITGSGSATAGVNAGINNDQGLTADRALFGVTLAAPSDQITGNIGTSTVTGTSLAPSGLQNFKVVADTVTDAAGNIGNIVFGLGNNASFKGDLLLGSNLTLYANAAFPTSTYNNTQQIIDLNGWTLNMSNVTAGSGLWSPTSTHGGGTTEWVILNSFNAVNGSAYMGVGANYANLTDNGILSAGGFSFAGNASTNTTPYYIGADVILQATNGGLANNLSANSGTASTAGQQGYLSPGSTFWYTGTGAASTLTTKQGNTSNYTTIGALHVGDGSNASTLRLLSPVTTGGSTRVEASSTLDLNGNALTVSKVTGGFAAPILTGTGTIANTGAAASRIAFTTGAGFGPADSAGTGTLTIDPGTAGITLDFTNATLAFNLDAGNASDAISFLSAAGATQVIFANNVIDFTDLTDGSLAPGEYTLFSIAGGSAADFAGFSGLSLGSGLSDYASARLELNFEGGAEVLQLDLNAALEPGTWALLLAGGACLAAWAHRARRPGVVA